MLADLCLCACVPFAGDYWPGEAENLLGNISEEARQAGRKGNKGSLTAGGKPRAKSAKVTSSPSSAQITIPRRWCQADGVFTVSWCRFCLKLSLPELVQQV